VRRRARVHVHEIRRLRYSARKIKCSRPATSTATTAAPVPADCHHRHRRHRLRAVPRSEHCPAPPRPRHAQHAQAANPQGPRHCHHDQPALSGPERKRTRPESARQATHLLTPPGGWVRLGFITRTGFGHRARPVGQSCILLTVWRITCRHARRSRGFAACSESLGRAGRPGLGALRAGQAARLPWSWTSWVISVITGCAASGRRGLAASSR